MFLRTAWLIAGLLFPLAVFAADDPVVGEVVYLKGSAEIGEAGNWRRARVGMALRAGEHVRTGPSSRIRMRFIDGTRIQMGQNAESVIERYQLGEDDGLLDALIALLQGRARFIVQKLKRADSSYKVRMRAVLIGVRGTDILAQAGQAVEHVALVEGRVALTPPAGGPEVLLAKGQYVKVEAQWPLQPMAIPQPWLDDFIRDVGLSSEGKQRKKKQSGDDDAPPASVIQQQSIDRLGAPAIVPR